MLLNGSWGWGWGFAGALAPALAGGASRSKEASGPPSHEPQPLTCLDMQTKFLLGITGSPGWPRKDLDVGWAWARQTFGPWPDKKKQRAPAGTSVRRTHTST